MTAGLEWFQSLINTGKDGLDQDASPADGATQDSELVSDFLERVEVSPIRNSRLVDVRLEAKDPVMAAKMANELVRAYINQNLEIKLSATKDAVQWLSDRISEERAKVEQVENDLLRYKEKHQIITDFSSDAEQITAQKLATLNQQVVEAESKRVEAETRYQQALALDDTPDMLDSIPEVLANDLVKEIKRMEVALYNRMSELSKKYGEKHPQMVAIESELASVEEAQGNLEARPGGQLPQKRVPRGPAREKSLKAALAEQKKESLDLNQKAIQYGVLRRRGGKRPPDVRPADQTVQGDLPDRGHEDGQHPHH